MELASFVEDVMERMRWNEFDVIVSNYQIPKKDGSQFLKELKTLETTFHSSLLMEKAEKMLRLVPIIFIFWIETPRLS